MKLVFHGLVRYPHMRVGESPETRRNGVNDLLVKSPNRIPLERDDSLRRTLGKHVLAKCLYGEPPATDAAHGGEAGVVPSTDDAVVHEPMQFALGQKRVDEVQTTAEQDVLVRGAHLRGYGVHLKSQMFTLRRLMASIIHWYWGLRSRYSFVRRAWVTPSCESTIGQAKS